MTSLLSLERQRDCTSYGETITPAPTRQSQGPARGGAITSCPMTASNPLPRAGTDSAERTADVVVSCSVVMSRNALREVAASHAYSGASHLFTSA